MSACAKTKVSTRYPSPQRCLLHPQGCWGPSRCTGCCCCLQEEGGKSKRPSFPLSPTDLSSRRLVPFPGLRGDLQPLHLLEPSRSAGAREEWLEPSCCLRSWASQAKPPLGLHPGLGISGYIHRKGAKTPRATQVKIPLATWFRPKDVCR